MIAQDGPIARRQWGVLAIVLAALVIDGIDTQLLALVAPLIMADWGVDKASFGPAMSAALIGMALGAGAGGWIGDRLGRKTVLVGAAVLFGLGTLAVGFVDGLWPLVALRLASGLGFGALAPNGAALVSEWLPDRVRPRALALLSITIPLGGLIGGSAVLALLPAIGWRGCFVLCGLGTLAMAGVILALLPESPGYLAAKGRHDEAERLVRRVTGRATHAEPLAVPASSRASVFTRANLRLNVAAWGAFFCLQLVAYGFISWAPVMLTMIGWPIDRAIRGSLVFNLSAVCASLIAGWLLGRFRFAPIAAGGAFGAAIGIVLLCALLRTSPPPDGAHAWATLATIGGVSVLVGFGITAIYTLLSFAYPAACRAGGIGMGLMAGRAGGIAIAFSGGVLLALDGGLPAFLATLGAAALAAMAFVLLMGRRYAGRVQDLTPAHDAAKR